MPVFFSSLYATSASVLEDGLHLFARDLADLLHHLV